MSGEDAGPAPRIALFGHPLGHSRSAELFGALARAGGPSVVYEPVSVREGQLEEALEQLRAGRWLGANVTIPHKRSVVAGVDRLEPAAQRAGAVNVLYREADGALVGANTDGIGFLAGLGELDLRERGEGNGSGALSGAPLDDAPRRFDAATLAGRRVVVLGAGGAARGVCAALRQIGARIALVTRDPGDRAAEWVPELADEALAWDDAGGLSAALSRSALVVQATPVGMAPDDGAAPEIPYGALGPDHVAVDLIYNPWRTRFLERAAATGARTLNGWPMLVQQAAAAAEIWLGEEAGRRLAEAAHRVESRDPRAG